MSLLDRGPHTVVVFPQVRTEDRYGSPVFTDGEPIPVRGAMQPSSADETEGAGTQASTQYTFIGRTWPGGVHSRAVWAGRDFDQDGEARVYSMSARTAHVDVTLQARSSEVK